MKFGQIFVLYYKYFQLAFSSIMKTGNYCEILSQGLIKCRTSDNVWRKNDVRCEVFLCLTVRSGMFCSVFKNMLYFIQEVTVFCLAIQCIVINDCFTFFAIIHYVSINALYCSSYSPWCSFQALLLTTQIFCYSLFFWLTVLSFLQQIFHVHVLM